MSVISQKYTPLTNATPIDLELAKRFLYVDFDEDDFLIGTLAKAAIAQFEKQTGRLLRPCACEVVTSEQVKGVLLPFRPFRTEPSRTDGTYTFEAGYDVDKVPEDVQLIVLNILSVMYEARGPIVDYPTTLQMQVKSYSLYP